MLAQIKSRQHVVDAECMHAAQQNINVFKLRSDGRVSSMWSSKYEAIAEQLYVDRQGANRLADQEQLIPMLVSQLELSTTTAQQLASDLTASAGERDYYWDSSTALAEFLETRVAELHEGARRKAIEELSVLRSAVRERIAAHRAQTELAAKSAAKLAAEWDALSVSIAAALEVLMEGPRT